MKLVKRKLLICPPPAQHSLRPLPEQFRVHHKARLVHHQGQPLHGPRAAADGHLGGHLERRGSLGVIWGISTCINVYLLLTL